MHLLGAIRSVTVQGKFLLKFAYLSKNIRFRSSGSLCWPVARWMVACIREVASKVVRGASVASGIVGTDDDFSFNATISENIWLAIGIL